MAEFEGRIDDGHEGEGVLYFSSSLDELPMNVALAKRLDSMSDDEWEEVLKKHLELAERYDGPGGP